MHTTSDNARAPLRALTALEARVLGVLVEKQRTVPDTYPLSLNALVAGCNQKTARTPVMGISDSEALAALDSLKHASLVIEASGNRVARFEHNLDRVLGLPTQAVALLATLLLRGAQTTAELRMNAARLHAFADNSSVEAFLDELATKTPPRVQKLRRLPGERESRWMHLLCGDVGQATDPASADTAPAGDDTRHALALLQTEHCALAAEVARLRAQLRHIARALDLDPDKAGDEQP